MTTEHLSAYNKAVEWDEGARITLNVRNTGGSKWKSPQNMSRKKYFQISDDVDLLDSDVSFSTFADPLSIK